MRRVATRLGKPSSGVPSALLRGIAPGWPWLLTAALVGYLGLMPGIVVADRFGWASETLAVGLMVLAFGGFVLALVTARAYERLHSRDV